MATLPSWLTRVIHSGTLLSQASGGVRSWLPCVPDWLASLWCFLQKNRTMAGVVERELSTCHCISDYFFIQGIRGPSCRAPPWGKARETVTLCAFIPLVMSCFFVPLPTTWLGHNRFQWKPGVWRPLSDCVGADVSWEANLVYRKFLELWK